MTIASEITRINNNIAAAYNSLSEKGATLPATQNSANLADCIDSIVASKGYNGFVAHGYPSIDRVTGEVTNFSSDNYLTIGKIDLTTADSWEMVACINVTDLGHYQFWYQQPVAIGLDNSNHLHIWGLPDGDVYSAGEIGKEKVYWVKVEFTGTQYNAYYKNFKDDAWQQIITVTSSNKVNVTTFPAYMGLNPSNTTEYFYGSIYLAECYIKVDDVVVWSGSHIDPWYTYGSLTINNGEISGFSSSNYIAANYIYSVKSTDSPEIQVHFKTPAAAFANYENLIMLTSTWFMGINLAVLPNNEGFVWMYNTEQIYCYASLQTDTEYWVKIAKYEDGYVRLYYSSDGENWTLLSPNNIILITQVCDREIQVGKHEGTPAADFEGQILTEGTFVKINGETVWNMAD